MAVAAALLARQSGAQSCRRVERAVVHARAATLAEGGDDPSSSSSSSASVASHARLFARSPGGGALLCLKLEHVTERFLLASDTRAAVHLYDCAAPGAADGAPASSGGCGRMLASSAAPAAAAAASRQLYGDVALPRHDAAITALSWYGADAGLFLTGGMDGRLLAWDAARFAPAFSWEADGPVYCVDLRDGVGSPGCASITRYAHAHSAHGCTFAAQ